MFAITPFNPVMLAAAAVPLTTPMAPVNTTLRATDVRRDVTRRRNGDDVAILNVAVERLIGWIKIQSCNSKLLCIYLPIL